MAIRAYHAIREIAGGPFESLGKARGWALKNLPIYSNDIRLEEMRKSYAKSGYVVISELSGSSCLEDVIIFNDEIFEPDEDGYVEV